MSNRRDKRKGKVGGMKDRVGGRREREKKKYRSRAK